MSNIIKNQMSIMELHFEYTLNGKGFDIAREDFINRSSNI